MRQFPHTDLLIWQQYIRYSGDANEILTRGFSTLIQSWASKRIQAEKIFPHLSPIVGLPLHAQVKKVFSQFRQVEHASSVKDKS